MKDFRKGMSNLMPDADYNPACFNFDEATARAKKLWRDDRPMPTEAEIDAAIAIVDVEEAEAATKKADYKQAKKDIKQLNLSDNPTNEEIATAVKLLFKLIKNS